MDLASYFPVWKHLSPAQQKGLAAAAAPRKVKKGSIVHNGANDCVGVLLLLNGQLRSYVISREGKELTLYRLFEQDLCLMAATGMISSIQFDVTIMAEKDTDVIVVPVETYKSLMGESAALANYTNEVIASRLSEIMWLMEQILWRSFDKRLAEFLLDECVLEESSRLRITHEAIGNHMGTAREVVTRMLRYFQNENMVRLSRGSVEVMDRRKLEAMLE